MKLIHQSIAANLEFLQFYDTLKKSKIAKHGLRDIISVHDLFLKWLVMSKAFSDLP